MRFKNRHAWLIVFTVCALIALSGCETHWYECTEKGQIYRNQERKLGLCAGDLDRYPYSYRLLQD